VDFEWDEAKSEATLRERGFDFAFAAGIFFGPVWRLRTPEITMAKSEWRRLARLRGRVLVVNYTDRDDRRRIISARQADRKERKLWR
jgi:uncharacterized protein